MIKKYLGLLRESMALQLSSEMAYKGNFFIKLIAVGLVDIVSPLLMLLIYTQTQGIPGWNLMEILFFQGTLFMIFGISHMFIYGVPYEIMDMIRTGNFDKVLIRPYNALLYTMTTSIDFDGFSEFAVGLFLIIFSSIKLNLALSGNILIYLGFMFLAIIFQYASVIIVSSLAFLVVKSYALFDIYFNLLDLAKYPTSIYSNSMQFVMTFVIPIAIISFYPASVILKTINPWNIILITLSVLAFLGFSILLWNLAIRKYTSSGG